MNKVQFIVDDNQLTAEAFLDLVQDVWPGSYDRSFTEEALKKTINVTAWEDDTLIGCVRILSDGYLFGTVPEILVRLGKHRLLRCSLAHSRATSRFLKSWATAGRCNHLPRKSLAAGRGAIIQFHFRYHRQAPIDPLWQTCA